MPQVMIKGFSKLLFTLAGALRSSHSQVSYCHTDYLPIILWLSPARGDPYTKQPYKEELLFFCMYRPQWVSSTKLILRIKYKYTKEYHLISRSGLRART